MPFRGGGAEHAAAGGGREPPWGAEAAPAWLQPLEALVLLTPPMMFGTALSHAPKSTLVHATGGVAFATVALSIHVMLLTSPPWV